MNRPGRFTWRVILLPFSAIYGIIIWVRNLLFDLGFLPQVEFDLPVISVGNISVGGTGKTPHVEYLIELLRDEFKIATLSRGYGRRTRQFLIATEQSTAEEIGDEPRQLKQKYPDITVAVDRRRVNGLRMLMKQDPAIDLVLLDDAYQHRYIKPGFSILLIDFNRPLNRNFLLPAGTLREPARNRDRANMILVTKSPVRMKPMEMRQYVVALGLQIRQHLFFTTISYDSMHPVYDIADPHDHEYFKKMRPPLLLVTGIADPRAVKKFARNISTRISSITFPDHHRYTAGDLERIEKEYLDMDSKDALIITTEKDAMRFQDMDPPDHIRRSMYMVKIKVRFLNNDATNFNKQIFNYVRSNKRDSILHKK